jgi:hypothetical protein
VAESRITPEPVAEISTAGLIDEEIEAEELPDWLREAQEEAEPDLEEFSLEPAAEGAAIVEDDLPAWLQQEVDEGDLEPFEPSEPSPEESFTEVTAEEELPDWLREAEEEAEIAVASPVEPVTEMAAEAQEDLDDEEGLPDWLQGMEAELEEEEIARPGPESVDEYEPETAADVIEEAEKIIEGAGKPETTEASAAPAEATIEEKAAAPVADAAPPASSRKMPDWLKKLRAGDLEEEDEQVAVPPRPVVTQVAAAMTPSKVEPAAKPESVVPEEAEERLRLARSARDTGDIDEAVQFYDSLVSSGMLLDRVIEDIRQTVKSYPSQPMLYQVMGDAMMKDGRLQSALDAYRMALSQL